MASRTAPKGTGQRILRKLIREAKKHKIPYLRLGTSYANAPMLFAALHEGFKIEGTDHYGYVVRLTI
jgi:L-amino acid N-acyltransferase YncA